MRFSNIILLICIVGGIADLSALGIWQVDRLKWKEALIERVNNQLNGEVLPILKVLELSRNSEDDIDYRPVRVVGEFDHINERYELTTHEGQSGWNVFVPLVLPKQDQIGNSLRLWVNRGFVGYDKKDPVTRPNSQPTGMQHFNGLLRQDIPTKPGFFVPDNTFEKQVFYWRNIVDLSVSVGADPDTFAPWYVDVGIPGDEALRNILPLAGSTRISFSNNHLQYIITWFGLALALLGVGSYFLYARRITSASKT